MIEQAPDVRLPAGRSIAVRACGRRYQPLLVRALGLAALLASVCCSAWIAVGVSDGRNWLELPGYAHPAWIEGPLHGLAGGVGSLPPGALGAALIGLTVAYLVALACAPSIPLRWALAGIGLANLAFTLGPTLLSTDVFGYISYARDAAVHGLNPYLSPPISAPHDPALPYVYWQHATSPYGPLFAALSTPLGLFSVNTALWIYKATAGLASVGIVWLVVSIARRRGVHPAPAAVFVGLNPVLLFYAVSGAHNDLLATLLVLAAISLALQGREAVGAGTAVAAAAVKVTLGLALPFVLIGAAHRRRALKGVALAMVAIGLPTLALFGPHVFDQLHRVSSDSQFDIPWSGPGQLAAALGTQIDGGIRAVSVALMAATAAAAGVSAWRGSDWITAAGWAILALIASIASAAPWYLVWLLPLAALGRSMALRSAALLLTGYLVAVHWSGWTGVAHLLGLP